MRHIKYLKLLEILADKLSFKNRTPLDEAIDEATLRCALVGTPRISVSGFGVRDLIYDDDWCVIVGDRPRPLLWFERDKVGKLVFHIDEPRKAIIDLFGVDNWPK